MNTRTLAIRSGLAALILLSGAGLMGGGCVPPPDGDGPLNAAFRFFQTALKFRTGAQPFALAAGDFNGDAWPDIVTTNQGDGKLSLLLSNGQGDFGEFQLLDAGTMPVMVRTFDLNGDGLLDIIAGNSGSSDLSLLTGAAGGAFLPPQSIPLASGAKPLDVATADLNADGHLDLVTADSGLGSVSILFGQGAGLFAPPVRHIAGDEPRALAISDITRDGNLDILCVNRLSGSLAVFAGDGAGGFADATLTPVGDRSFKLAVADVNGDGLSDVLVANAGSKDVNVLLGDAAGGLTSAGRIGISSAPLDVAFGDFNNDGKLDFCALLVLETGTSTLALGMIEMFHGDGAAGFDSTAIYGGGSQSLAMIPHDMNRDARLDLLMSDTALDRVSIVFGKDNGTLESDRRTPTGLLPRIVRLVKLNNDNHFDLIVLNFQSRNFMVYHGLGGGAFQLIDTIATTDFPRALALGDLNKDTRLDLVLTNVAQGSVSVFPGTAAASFGTQSNFAVREGGGSSGVEPRSVAIADLNKDGNLDVVTANVKSDSISVLLGDGAGNLGAAKEFFMGNFPLDVHLADLNGDGNLDAAAANGIDPEVTNAAQPRVSVMFGNGDGTFDLESRKQYSTGDSPIAMLLADVTQDGKLDALTLHAAGNFVYLLQGNGAGGFLAGVPESVGQSPAAMTLADINRDGRPDVVSANRDETISVMLNLGNLSLGLPMNYYASADPTSIAAADLNDDGLVDLVFTNEATSDFSVMLGRPLN